MVVSFRSGQAGATSSAGAMTEHLSIETDVPEMTEQLAAYLGSTYEPAVERTTAAVPMRDMHPLAAKALGIDAGRALRPAEVTNLLSGRRADGGAIRRVGANTTIAYTDFTFSAPKSFSLALVMAPTPAERAILEQCWLKANDALAKHIGGQIGRSRSKDTVIDGHMAVIQFHHYTSRPTVKVPLGPNDTELIRVPTHIPGDMQRHTHNVFLHAAVGDDGKVRAPNLDEMRDRVKEWGAIGHAYLATYLREHGINVELDAKTGMSRLSDVLRDACDLFRNRTKDGEALARAYAWYQGIDWDSLDGRARAKMLKGGTKAARNGKGDDLADYRAWMRTAEEAGYRHRSVLRPDTPGALPDTAERIKAAYNASLPLLEADLSRSAKLDGWAVRLAAARGLIASGIQSPADIDLVTAAFRSEGVRQDGRLTPLAWSRETGRRFASVTTKLHVEQEREAIGVLSAAAADRSAALTPAEIEAAIERVSARRGYDFTFGHGLQQRAVVEALAGAGRAAVAIGVAGSGKTVSLEPLIDAYHAAGWRSVGVSLAWRQTYGLKDAGVKGVKPVPDTRHLTGAGVADDRALALQPFLKRAEAGELALDRKTLVVVDEIATIGTRQVLQLARLQARYGFKIVGLGDDRQCQSIEAGATVDLFRRALGSEQLPEILATVRQKRLEDRETAALFREGQGTEAILRKRCAGLLQLAPGGYEDAIKAGVDEWERRIDANAARPGYTIGISVPNNADAHAVGLEVKRRARAGGRLRGPDHRVRAIDQRGERTDLAIAVGDRVRLFNRVNASYGGGSRGYFGDNGTVADVVAIDAKRGLTLQRQDGRIGVIAWNSIADHDTGCARLAYGSALTIDARQGDTLTDHITVLPNGSKAVDAFRIYPADTRNREDSIIVVSHGAEKQAVLERGLATGISIDDAILANIGRNFSRQVEKPLAVEFLEGAMRVFQGSVDGHRAAWHRSESAMISGKEPDLADRFQNRRDTISLVSLLEAIKASTITARFVEFLRDEAGTTPRQKLVMTLSNARAEFADHLRREGFQLSGEPIMDGKWRHAKVEGDRVKPSGRYRGFLDDRPNGQYIRSKIEDRAQSWRSEQPARLWTEDDRQRIAESRAASAAERKAAEQKAGKRAFAIWANARPAASHPYLTAKGVGTHGLRQDDRGNLLVPMADEHQFLRNFQTIDAEGNKLYQKDARKTGLFATLGAIDPAGPVLIAEGFATAASLREATGLPVIVAFDSGNLLPVATALRAKHQDLRIILAADNDHHLPRQPKPLPNVGCEKAHAAAQAVGGEVIMPVFEAFDTSTDWNDLARSQGKGALRAEVASQLRVVGIELPNRVDQAARDRARATARSAPMQPHQQAEQSRQLEASRLQLERRHNQQGHDR